MREFKTNAVHCEFRAWGPGAGRCGSRTAARTRTAYDRSVRPKKKWGQNFLRNRGAVERIVAAVEAQPDDVIVEIGPGEGVLTEKLVALPNRVVAVEIDPE